MQNFFISSTFKDMQQERDILHDIVLPEITEFAKKYGKTVDFSDLRWGIDSTDLDENESAGRVLQVCFDEIDRAKPFIIVLLGDRYGWVPKKEIVHVSLEQQGRKIEAFEKKSVTELEILYGILERQEIPKCRFYFREMQMSILEKMKYAKEMEVYQAENHADARKMKLLKRQIQEQYPDCVKTYPAGWDSQKKELTGLETFAAMVTEDIKQMLAEEWGEPKKLSVMQQQENQYWFSMESDLYDIGPESFYTPMLKEKMGNLLSGGWMREKQNQMLFADTTHALNRLIGTLACKYRKKGVNVIPYDCSNSLISSDVSNLIDYLTWKVSEIAGFSTESQAEEEKAELSVKIREFHNCLRKYDEEYAETFLFKGRRKLVIVIRGLEQLNETNLFKWFPKEEYKHIYFVIAGTKYQEGSQKFQERTETTYFPDGKLFSTRGWISLFMQKHHKQIDMVTEYALVEKSEGKPELYLELLMQQLLMLNKEDYEQIQKNGDGMQAISAYLCEVIQKQPEDLYEVRKGLLQKARAEAGEAFTNAVLGILCAIPYSISKEHLKQLLKQKGITWSELQFTVLRRMFDFAIVETLDGQWMLRQGGAKELLCGATIPHLSNWPVDIYKYMLELDPEDVFFKNQCLLMALRARDRRGFWNCLSKMKEKDAALCLYQNILQTNAGNQWLIQTLGTLESEGTSRDKVKMQEIMEWCVEEWYPYLKQNESLTEILIIAWSRLAKVIHHYLYAEEVAETKEARVWSAIYFKVLFQLGEMSYLLKDRQALKHLEKAKEWAKEDFKKWPNEIYKKMRRMVRADEEVTLGYGTELQDALMECSYSEKVRIIDQYLSELYLKAGEEEKAKALRKSVADMTKMLDPNPNSQMTASLCEGVTICQPECFEENPSETSETKKYAYAPDFRRNTAIQHAKIAAAKRPEGNMDEALSEYAKSNEILQEIYEDGKTGEYYNLNGVVGDKEEIRVHIQTECLRDMGINYEKMSVIYMEKEEIQKCHEMLQKMMEVSKEFDHARNSLESKADLEDHCFIAAQIYYRTGEPQKCLEICMDFMRYRGEAARKGEPLDSYMKEHRAIMQSILYQTVVANPQFGPRVFEAFLQECNNASMGQDFETYVNLIQLICDLTEWMWEQKLDWATEKISAEDLYVFTVVNLCDLYQKYGRSDDFDHCKQRLEKAFPYLKRKYNVNKVRRIIL